MRLQQQHKNGLALAIAGRSAGPETSGVSALLDATNRRAILQDFAQHWSGMEYLFGAPFEISGTNVSRLWDGVSSPPGIFITQRAFSPLR